MDCAEEVLLVRRRFDREPGVHNLSFDLVRAKVVVEYDPRALDAGRIRRAIEETGLRCESWVEGSEAAGGGLKRHARTLLAGISGLSLAVAMAWQAVVTGDVVGALLVHEHHGHHMTAPVVARCRAAIAAGAVFVLPKAAHSLRRLQPDMNALVTISLVGAIYLGEWLEGATLAFLFALAALLESYSLARARNAVSALLKVTPGEAAVLHHDHEHRVPVEQVQVGATVRVRPGERIPCDGEVLAGNSDVNQAMITGESVPVWKTAGQAVFAGTVNGDGILEIRTTKPAADTTLARIIRMVESVQHRRAPSEQFVEKFARYYTPAMILLAVIVATLPPLLMGWAWGDAFYQSMVILLISCPCALVISTPVSIVAALGSAARQGVLVKGGAFLEETARLKVVAFDKTGVLTQGEPEVKALVPLADFPVREVLERLAAVEFRSGHPLARAVVRYARRSGVRPQAVENFQTRQGLGAEGDIGGERFWVGSLRMMAEKGLDADAVEALVREAEERGETVVACGTESQPWALITLADPPRPEARGAVAGLRAEGIERVVLLTGDNRATAQAVGKAVGVDEVRAALLPEDKSRHVGELKQRYRKVAMVGDGVNDAQAMANATVGIALGGSAMDAVLETADVVLMSGELKKLPFLLRHARRTLRVIHQNVGIALVMKAAFLLLALLGLATLWMAVAADMGATMIVSFNGLRLLRPRA